PEIFVSVCAADANGAEMVDLTSLAFAPCKFNALGFRLVARVAIIIKGGVQFIVFCIDGVLNPVWNLAMCSRIRACYVFLVLRFLSLFLFKAWRTFVPLFDGCCTERGRFSGRKL